MKNIYLFKNLEMSRAKPLNLAVAGEMPRKDESSDVERTIAATNVQKGEK